MMESTDIAYSTLSEAVGLPFRYYVSESGAYLGATDGDPLSEFEVMVAPFSSDQTWMFPGWSESPSWAKMREDQWREEQMSRIAKQLLMIEDENPKAEPGTARQWRQYRISVMDWVEGENPDFPDETKRPVAPE